MKMIIVDDERAGREGLMDFIDWRTDYGIEITGTAANGQEGYELYRSVQPDIVLTDIKMPIMNGITMAEKIRASDKTVKIALLSAYSEFKYAQQAVKMGVDDYLLKPIEESELRKMMDRMTSEMLDHRERQHSRQYFLDILGGKKEDYAALSGYSYQVFVLGKEPELKFNASGMWLMEFYEGVNVGIARYESVDPAAGFHNSAREGFEVRYAGSRVQGPEEIRRSYKEAVLTQYIGFYWELKELEYAQVVRRRDQWSTHEAEIQQELMKLSDDIRAAVNGLDRSKVQAAVHRTLHYLSHNQGLDPAYVEDFIMRLASRMAEEFAGLNDIKDSLWELRISLHELEHFRQVKGILSGWLMMLTDKAEEKQRKSDTTIVQTVIGIIDQEYDRDIGLRTIAERVYLTPNYLGNIFRQETGMYFNDYLASLRMKKAAELLVAGADKVADIGEAVGMTSTSYFSSLFKKTFGVTPKEYRRYYRKQ
ncbi:response regulator [Paenibacillus lemnae]|uniref:Response regulator n=1 Tax=Paenibacillus lemnae TaxID=1330551 RepID=A0A848M1Y1_PAELE|nr:response regulator [Paenibacillus lemnae]NMO94968.1 response regulator [Paenibacillus lemnae]